MAENNEMNEKHEASAENMNEYRCAEAKSLRTCGVVIMIIGFLLAFIFFCAIIASWNHESEKVMKHAMGLIVSFFGGYLIWNILNGFAVIVEAQYRKSIQG